MTTGMMLSINRPRMASRQGSPLPLRSISINVAPTVPNPTSPIMVPKNFSLADRISRVYSGDNTSNPMKMKIARKVAANSRRRKAFCRITLARPVLAGAATVVEEASSFSSSRCGGRAGRRLRMKAEMAKETTSRMMALCGFTTARIIPARMGAAILIMPASCCSSALALVKSS